MTIYKANQSDLNWNWCVHLKPLKTQMKKTEAEFQQMVEARIKKIEEINQSVELSKVSFVFSCFPIICMWQKPGVDFPTVEKNKLSFLSSNQIICVTAENHYLDN